MSNLNLYPKQKLLADNVRSLQTARMGLKSLDKLSIALGPEAIEELRTKLIQSMLDSAENITSLLKRKELIPVVEFSPLDKDKW